MNSSVEPNSIGQPAANGKRILVTGGAGFIGANLVRMLLQYGYQLTVLDNLSTGRWEYLKGLPLDLVRGDILDEELVKQLVPSHHGIVHLAAQSGVPASLANPRRDCEVNVIGTLNLLEACRQVIDSEGRTDRSETEASLTSPSKQLSSPGRKTADKQQSPRFVLASSGAPLGRQLPPADEDKAPLPVSPYGASKLAAEAYCLAYHGSWGLGTVVLRFGNVYGPFSLHKGSVVVKFLRDMTTKKQITIDGDGQQTRDFVYVTDLCHCIVLALESTVTGEVFQIASGVETTIQSLAEMVKNVAGYDTEIRYGPGRKGDIRKNFSVIGKARKLLGWEPKVDLHTGLLKMAEWFPQNLDSHTTAEKSESR